MSGSDLRRPKATHHRSTSPPASSPSWTSATGGERPPTRRRRCRSDPLGITEGARTTSLGLGGPPPGQGPRREARPRRLRHRLLALLRPRFSLDMLKIDKSFIDGIDSSPKTAPYQNMVSMAQALGMVTVAERSASRTAPVAAPTRVQAGPGLRHVRPIPGEDFEAILRRHDRPVRHHLRRSAVIVAPVIIDDRVDFLAPHGPVGARHPDERGRWQRSWSPNRGPLEFVAPTDARPTGSRLRCSKAHLVGAVVRGA